MPGDFVQIDAFCHEIGAHLSGMRLEWAGIRCFYNDEHIVAINWLLSFAVGRVKLAVAAADAGRAVEILREEPSAATAPDKSIVYDPALPRCPQCESPDVYPVKVNRRLSYALWLAIGGPIPIPSRKWRCIDCGYEWKPGRGWTLPNDLGDTEAMV